MTWYVERPVFRHTWRRRRAEAGLAGVALALVATTQARPGAEEPDAPYGTTLSGAPIGGAWTPGSR